MQFFILVIPNQYYVLYPSRQLYASSINSSIRSIVPPPTNFLVLLDLRQYYEKSNLAVFLSFVYLSSTLWGLPTAKVHDPVPWGDTIKLHAKK
jgi:hypothetical protein